MTSTISRLAPREVSTALRSGRTILALVIVVPLCTIGSLTIGGPAVVLLIVAALGIVLSVRRPAVGFVVAATIGIANGFLRRIAGWLDPAGLATQIVPVLPAFMLVVLYLMLFVLEKRRSAKGLPLPFILVCIVIVGAGINPGGTGLVSNMLASLLLLSGVLAFALTYHRRIGRASVFWAIAGLGSINALYMIHQEVFGLTPWDQYWVNRYGYSALYLGPDLVRPLGLGASAAESAAMCAVLVGVAVARLSVSRNWLWIAPTGIGLYAVLTSGTRTFALPALAAVLLCVAIGRKRPVLVGLVTVGLTLPVVVIVAERLLPAVSSAGAARVLTLLSGGENEETSTVGIHQDLIFTSLLRGLSSVVGSGSGQVSVLASSGLGSSEQDISNMALIGGVLGVIAIVSLYVGFFRIIPAAFRDVTVAPYLLAAFATIGQWLNVGYYGVTPLVWAALGIVLSVRKVSDAVGVDWERDSGDSDRRAQSIHRGIPSRDEGSR